MYVPVQNPPTKGELLHSRDSIEIQNCREWTTAELDLESLFDSSSTPHYGKTHCAEMNSCVGFENDSKDSRPPDGQQITLDELNDTPLSLDDPINSTLIQNLLSELQSHTPSSNTTPTPEPDCEVPDSVFNSPPSPAVASSLGSPDTPLERTPSNSFTDPMDVPLLFSNFPNMSLLMQDVNPLLSMKVGEASQPLESAGGLEVSPLTPEGNAVDVTVMNSSNYVVDKQVLDLSDCVNFLDSTSSYDPMMLLSSECTTSSATSSPPPSTNTSTPLPSSPSPSTLTTNPPSPTTTSQQTSLSFDFDFTAISQQELASVVSKLSSTSSLPSPVGENVDNTALLSSRKRTSSLSFAEDGPSDAKVARTVETPRMGEEERKKVRRDKNNKASQVSRARRKQRRKDQELRAEELEEENAKLRVQVETISTQIAELKKLLVNRLAQ